MCPVLGLALPVKYGGMVATNSNIASLRPSDTSLSTIEHSWLQAYTHAMDRCLGANSLFCCTNKLLLMPY